jgi:hypothetical protein
MNQDYIIYAEKIKDVGDKLCEISDNLKPIDTNAKISDEELRGTYFDLLGAIDKYRKCKSDLLKISQPNIRAFDEYAELSNAIQMFIDGTELVTKGIDISTSSINEMMILRGMILQKLGKKQTLISVDKIVSKFIKK